MDLVFWEKTLLISNMNIQGWKLFEKFVAAINKMEANGAEVTWNNKIDGRQFDVTIEFQHGHYNYLTVIECKNLKKAVPISLVESFITKSRKVNANKAIMVSASDFQSGAIKCASEEGIDLFTLEVLNNFKPDEIASDLIPAVNVFSIDLLDENRQIVYSLSRKEYKANFQLKSIMLEYQNQKGSLEKEINKVSQLLSDNATDKPKVHIINFPVNTRAKIPISGECLNIRFVSLKYWLVSAIGLKKSGLEPYLRNREYKYQNVITGEKSMYASHELKVGTDTLFKPGRYYLDPHNDFKYRCEKIEDDLATILLLESYQHGKLFMARVKMNLDKSNHYLEITDGDEINRLEKMYQKFLEDTGDYPK